MQYSYSRVSLFEQCPYHFKLRYINKLKEIPDYSPTSPLILGHALHTGIETNNKTMLDEYYKSFPIVTNEQVNEAIKLEGMLPKVKEFIKNNFGSCELIHEYKIDKPNYVGYVDLIAVTPTGECIVIDFKYSNNIKSYLESEQLHIYKHYLEQDGFKVKKLGYLFVEKVSARQSKKEDLFHFRKRINSLVKKATVTYVPIEFDSKKVTDFLVRIKEIEHTDDYPKNPNGKCFACAAIENKKSGKYSVLTAPDYLEKIQDKNGEIQMALPSTQRRDISKVTKKVMWWYGAPFTGKTTFANEFPNPLMLNTDGNIKFVDAPYVSIADQVTSTGRVTNIKKAWEILDETVSELEKGDNDFETIIFDLLEDMYQACRFYEYEKLGIEHESDNSFKAWDIIRNAFLQMIKRIVHLPYNNIIFISHEDISKDVMKKSGDKITSISPNLQDKAALKVAGMVDIVGRIVADDDVRKMEFKSKDYVFGGGRLPNLAVTEIDLDLDQLEEVYQLANKGLSVVAETSKVVDKEPKERKSRKKKESETSETDTVTEETETVEEKPKRERRRKKAEVEVTNDETPPGEESVEKETEAVETKEELPKRKRRERKTVEEEPVEETTTRRRRRRG
jgi:phage nucleotide-binding protein